MSLVCRDERPAGLRAPPRRLRSSPDGASRTRTGDLLGAIRAANALAYLPHRARARILERKAEEGRWLVPLSARRRSGQTRTDPGTDQGIGARSRGGHPSMLLPAG